MLAARGLEEYSLLLVFLKIVYFKDAENSNYILVPKSNHFYLLNITR